MNVLLDYQVILLPKKNYWKWVRACSKYVIEFGANLTDDPQSAISYMAPSQVITFPSGVDLFPDHDDVESWLREVAPGVRLDPVAVRSTKELKAALSKRIDDDDRYGQKQKSFYMLWPTDYPVITQAFGANPQIYRRFGMPGHEGLDIRALTNTNVYSCAGGTVYEVHTNPKDHPYGIHVRVRHKDGYRTVYGHLARALVSVGQSIDAGQVLGKADSSGASTAAHLHLTLERDGATARKETKYPKDVLDPTPFMVWPDRSRKKSLPSLTWPAGRCLVGGRTWEKTKLTACDLDLARSADLEAVQIEASESAMNVARLRQIRPGMLIIARLNSDLSGGPVSPGDFVAEIARDLKRMAAAGVNYFEVTSQPNLQSDGWGRSWRSGYEFGEWFQEVLGALRDVEPQVRFGFPGLAQGADVVSWRGDADRFLAEAQAAADASDWIGVSFYGAPPAPNWEKVLTRLLASYDASFPGKLLFLSLDDQEYAGVDPVSRTRSLTALFRRLRNERNLGAAFCYDFAAAHGHDGSESRQAASQSLSAAKALGQRDF
jgi:murein DD-endopeptidase MepM/ murein hydrolase activator NlpD